MNSKLLFIMSCFVFLLSCSAQEDLDNFTGKPINATNPDTIAKPGNLGDGNNSETQPEIIAPIVAKNTVVAHRGAWKKQNFPQNSIASLKEAIRLECKGSEFDILLTADDSLVVCHDDKYNNLNVQNSKYADLVSFKLSNGEKLPTLAEYILAGKQNNTTTRLICELKNYSLGSNRVKVLVTKTEELVKRLNAEQLIVYISFDYKILKQLRALNSVTTIQYLNGDVSPDQLMLDKISGADYNLTIYKNNPDWIASAVKNDLNLGVWTVNNEVDMSWFLKNNFDYITTDEPELLLSKK